MRWCMGVLRHSRQYQFVSSLLLFFVLFTDGLCCTRKMEYHNLDVQPERQLRTCAAYADLVLKPPPYPSRLLLLLFRHTRRKHGQYG